MTITPRAARLLKAVEHYKTNYKRWDTLNIFPKVNILDAANGRMSGTFEVTEEMLNLAGTLHGGFTFGVMDMFGSFAIMQHPRGALSWTTDMNVAYLNRAVKGDIVQVDIRPVTVTKNRSVMECVVSNLNTSAVVAKALVGVFAPNQPRNFPETLPFDPAQPDEPPEPAQESN